jgi:phage baseplate assembly protein W
MKPIYSDIDMSFTANPLTGDIGLRTNEASIKAAVKMLVLTNYFEKPFHSEVGSPVKGMLFENVTPLLDITIREAIAGLINEYEPRVSLNDITVNVSPDNNRMFIGITFTIRNTMQRSNVELTLNRTR